MPRTYNQKMKLVYILDILYKETDKDHGITINEFDNSLIGVVIDRFSKNVLIEKLDNSFIVRTKVALSPQFFGWCFSFKDKGKILSPKKAKDEYIEYLESVLIEYNG